MEEGDEVFLKCRTEEEPLIILVRILYTNGKRFKALLYYTESSSTGIEVITIRKTSRCRVINFVRPEAWLDTILHSRKPQRVKSVYIETNDPRVEPIAKEILRRWRDLRW